MLREAWKQSPRHYSEPSQNSAINCPPGSQTKRHNKKPRRARRRRRPSTPRQQRNGPSQTYTAKPKTASTAPSGSVVVVHIHLHTDGPTAWSVTRPETTKTAPATGTQDTSASANGAGKPTLVGHCKTCDGTAGRGPAYQDCPGETEGNHCPGCGRRAAE